MWGTGDYDYDNDNEMNSTDVVLGSLKSMTVKPSTFNNRYRF